MRKPKVLSTSFYTRPTEEVGRGLIGKILCRRLASGALVSGRIVETEAYLGLSDPACHSYHGKLTPRVRTLYETGGIAYIYFIYGVYYCLNVVTRPKGEPEAVLIRAVEPIAGVDEMRLLRPKASYANLSSGPGKLCQAFAIDFALNGTDLRNEPLWIADDGRPPKEAAVATRRIGIDYAGEAANWPLRFVVPGNPFVSRPQVRAKAGVPIANSPL